MAVTGLVLFGFLVGHVAGNLQVFEGAKKLDDYSVFLHEHGGLLWGTRAVLLVALVLHVWSAIQLERLKTQARAVPYQAPKRWRAASPASRTMLVSGALVLVFIVLHLLHFTFGWKALHPTFEEGAVFHNVVTAFERPLVAIGYVAAMAVLFLHVQHGAWSLLQSLGVRGPTDSRKRVSTIVAAILALGFAAIPLAVLAGLVRS